ncbi:HIRAN domain-containing protein [Brucella intermedia]|uniref:HIRAN domain-containing protein n=1 Tax=Brucella intermedia TaxID=94625 RepID=UPI00158FA609|nr:HIRAN domain-containing protein [Brucella intermedia]
MIWFVIGVACIIAFVFIASKRAAGIGRSDNIKSNFVIAGDGDYDFDIVGESNYQDVLERIAGRSDESAEYYCTAQLVPEPKNPHDNRAIRVDIDSLTVGYISRNETSDFHSVLRGRSANVDALIVGGWERGKRGRGHFGVKLDIAVPVRLE